MKKKNDTDCSKFLYRAEEERKKRMREKKISLYRSLENFQNSLGNSEVMAVYQRLRDK